jgi:hypothetical protein
LKTQIAAALETIRENRRIDEALLPRTLTRHLRVLMCQFPLLKTSFEL